jgi:hypothetical protein
VLERFISYGIAHGSFGGFTDYLSSHFTWHRFLAVQLWVFVLFLIYTGLAELNARLGHGELVEMLLTRHATHPRPRHHGG